MCQIYSHYCYYEPMNKRAKNFNVRAATHSFNNLYTRNLYTRVKCNGTFKIKFIEKLDAENSKANCHILKTAIIIIIMTTAT